jgi:hypothetical protein
MAISPLWNDASAEHRLRGSCRHYSYYGLTTGRVSAASFTPQAPASPTWGRVLLPFLLSKERVCQNRSSWLT